MGGEAGGRESDAEDGEQDTAQATRGDDRAADERPEAVARTSSQPDPLPGYVWYVRVADVAGFLRQVAPVLEAGWRPRRSPATTGRLP